MEKLFKIAISNEPMSTFSNKYRTIDVHAITWIVRKIHVSYFYNFYHIFNERTNKINNRMCLFSDGEQEK